MEFLVIKLFICFTGILNVCEAVGTSTVGLARSQTMGAASRLSPFKQRMEPRMRTESELSSTFRELDPRPSTSSQRDVSLHETESLIGSRRASLSPTIDLTAASIPTNHGMNLNPQRDGVFARVRHIIFGTLAPTAVGVGIGSGAVALINSTYSSKPTTIPAIDPELENMNIMG